MYQTIYQSLIGPLKLVANDQYLLSIEFVNSAVGASASDGRPHHPILKNTIQQLTEYFAGKRRDFDLSLNFAGTDFQNQVWRALQKIPFGKTVSYKDIAKKINRPKAVRALGSANGKNPLPIVVPCHRVINHNQGLGGYSAGLGIKKQLLQFESDHS